MKKKGAIKTVIMTFLFFALFRFLQILIQPFTGGIISFFRDELSAGNIIKNVVFYIAFWSCFLFVIRDDYRKKEQKRRIFLALLLIQLAVSSLRCIVSFAGERVFFIVAEACIPAQWLAVYLLIDRGALRKGRRQTIAAAFAIVWFAVVLFQDMRMISQIDQTRVMYLDTSFVLTNSISTGLFRYGFRYAMSEAVFAALYIILVTWPSGGEELDRFNVKRLFSVRVSQTLLVSLFVVFVCVACVVIAPKGCIITVNKEIGDSSREYTLFCNNQALTIRRATEAGELKNIYYRTTCKVYSSNKAVTKIKTDGFYSTSYWLKQNAYQAVLRCASEDTSRLHPTALFCEKKIVIEKDKKAAVIPIEKLPAQERSEELLALCRYLAEEKQYRCFPYYAAYLVRWDPDFIEPYLTEYAEMESSLSIELCKYGIRPEFVQKEAVKMLSELLEDKGTELLP